MDDLISRQQEIDALDTAIEHYDGIAEECRKKADIERNDYMDMRDDAYEARQLAQWLNELKYLREKIEQLTIKPEPKVNWLYDYLVKRLGKSIVDNKEEFHKWFERMVWHVKRCDELFEERRSRQWIPVSERLPSKEERKEWIDNNLDGIGYLYPCLVTRYSSINPDRTKNNPYVAKHYFDGEDFLNAGEEVCSEYIIAWMPLPEVYKPNK